MKPLVLMLLIGPIIAFSDLVGRGEAGRRATRRLRFIPAALRNTGVTRGRR
jgi:hypothetical protein